MSDVSFILQSEGSMKVKNMNTWTGAENKDCQKKMVAYFHENNRSSKF